MSNRRSKSEFRNINMRVSAIYDMHYGVYFSYQSVGKTLFLSKSIAYVISALSLSSSAKKIKIYYYNFSCVIYKDIHRRFFFASILQ